MSQLPRIFCVYNPGAHPFDPGVPVLPWFNCGMPRQPLALPSPTSGWCMVDREVHESDRFRLRSEWGSLLSALGPSALPIAYAPFGWDPWLLSSTLAGAERHFKSRLSLLPSLTGYAALASDIYYPFGYSYSNYDIWARAILQAHLRACLQAKVEPVLLVHLDRDMEMQTRFIRVAPKAIRWGLWSDLTEGLAATMTRGEAVVMHESRARQFVAMLGGRSEA